MIDTNVSDEEFFAAARAAKEEKDLKDKKASGNFSYAPKQYEEVKWAGLESGTGKVVRFVGANPNTPNKDSAKKPYDPIQFNYAKVLSDDGTEVRIKIPTRESDSSHNHIMWRIIDAVKEPKWVDDPTTPGKKKKIPKHEGNYWFDRIVHGGYDPSSKSYTYSKGWTGQNVVVTNVIDRSDDWCATNKHTKLLSKEISLYNYTDENGQNVTREYPAVGVPTHGFLDKISIDLCGQYGNWMNYDVLITKTGDKLSPYTLKNASRYKSKDMLEELGDVTDIVVVGPLTEAEANYNTYDIQKMFAPTTYSKLMRYFGSTIKAVDAALSRHYYEELQGLVDREKEMWKEMYGESSSEPSETSVSTSTPLAESTVATPTVAPTVESPVPQVETVSAPSSNLDSYKISLLKGWDKLTPAEKAQITDVTLFPDGTVDKIVFTSNSAPLVDCPVPLGGCGKSSPSDFRLCPICGAVFG